MTDPDDILKVAHSFYSNLYRSTNPNNICIEKYLERTKIPNRLTKTDKEVCEGMVTESECLAVIKRLKKNKAPGLDGLPAEFYVTFWDCIGSLVVESYDGGFRKGQLSESQATSVLSLIFKKKIIAHS